MRRLLLTLLVALPVMAFAQTVGNFETPALPKVDTFYLPTGVSNKQDVGINSGLAHFPLYVDTQYKSWYGFTISSMTDSVNGGNGNQYSVRAGAGVNGSMQYAVHYGDTNKVFLTGSAQGKGLQGFYITNSSYTYYSIQNGFAPFSRKFGDTTGTGLNIAQGSVPDYFRLIIQGYRGGALKPDTIQYYLADFRSSDSTKDYIVKDWQWLSLQKLGAVDSLLFRLQSSDTSVFGGVTYNNTPAYFCLDDFTTNETVNVPYTSSLAAKVYPNPANDVLYVELANAGVQTILLYDMGGRVVVAQEASGAKEAIDMHTLPAGSYLVRLMSASGEVASQRISHQ